MTIRIRSLLLLAVVIVLAGALVGCTGSSGDTTTTTSTGAPDSGEDLVFGRGEIPSTVPSDFPIPEQAQIGATLVNRPSGLTELVVTYPANVTAVVANYETNLEALAYTVESSSGTDASWSITFSKGDLKGEITIATAGSGLSSGAIRIIQPVSG
jgi:hypothetical protein